MLIVSAPPPISGTLLRARVLIPCISSTVITTTVTTAGVPRISPVFSVRSSLRRCPCGIYSSKTRAVAELTEEKELKDRTSAPRRMAVLASDTGAGKEGGHPRSFLNVRTEEDLLSCIRKEVERGRLPETVATGLDELYHNYRNAVICSTHNKVLQSGNPGANEIILSNMAVAFDRILLDVEDPFTFAPHHEAIREPFDYYMFGQNYIRPLIDFRRSYIGNISLFYDVEEKLRQGQNVVLISNHQTEADPAVIALLLETTNPHLAEKVTYVAGDRVLTDPLCKPFSMGRNLVCVYSKKHMYDIPELVEMKMRANTRSLKEMALLLRAGGQLIWIAPSGGRDRPDPQTGEWCPAPFDASSVDNIRRLADHSGVPGHIYPLSLLCHDVMPPPPRVEKQIGERRMISFHGVGLSIGPKADFKEIAAGCENPEEAKVTFSEAMYNAVTQQYNVLKSAIHGYQGLNASNSIVTLSQPWK